jgi:hypothetical protein
MINERPIRIMATVKKFPAGRWADHCEGAGLFLNAVEGSATIHRRGIVMNQPTQGTRSTRHENSETFFKVVKLVPGLGLREQLTVALSPKMIAHRGPAPDSRMPRDFLDQVVSRIHKRTSCLSQVFRYTIVFEVTHQGWSVLIEHPSVRSLPASPDPGERFSTIMSMFPQKWSALRIPMTG